VLNLILEQITNQLQELSVLLELQIVYISQLLLRFIDAESEVDIGNLLGCVGVAFVFELEGWQEGLDVDLGHGLGLRSRVHKGIGEVA
jgi:hypothetical protein